MTTSNGRRRSAPNELPRTTLDGLNSPYSGPPELTHLFGVRDVRSRIASPGGESTPPR